MVTFEDIQSRKEKIALVGLGYVGMPIAVSFAKKCDVIGFDINEEKINHYKNGKDVTNEVGDEALKQTTVKFTSNKEDLKEARFHIVAVPTPIKKDKTPNLKPVIGATETVGEILQKGSIIVYESTVYPGVTEEICIPILEEKSGLKCGVDFKVGYSPERINPGDQVHRLETIVKVVSGMDEESLETIAKVYELVIEAGVYRAESIKVAEAAKVIENSQRDVNIAFVNELAIIFEQMGIDTLSVLKAAGTKWNFLNFKPGLVGGHCIGVDPYYLTYKAAEMGYHSQVILSGRRINDGMGAFVAQNTVKQLIKADKNIKNSKVVIMGITFKEDCPDVRNSRVIDIIDELKEYGINVIVHDPIADPKEVKEEYSVELTDIKEINEADAIIFAVEHKDFKEETVEKLSQKYKEGKKVLIDVKGLFDKKQYEKEFEYWRL